jgi:hypothetical protein
MNMRCDVAFRTLAFCWGHAQSDLFIENSEK